MCMDMHLAMNIHMCMHRCMDACKHVYRPVHRHAMDVYRVIDHVHGHVCGAIHRDCAYIVRARIPCSLSTPSERSVRLALHGLSCSSTTICNEWPKHAWVVPSE